MKNKLNGFVPAKDESGNYKRTEEGLLLGVYEMPDLKAVNQTLFLMVEEGLSIEAEEKMNSRRSLTKEQLLRGGFKPLWSWAKSFMKNF